MAGKWCVYNQNEIPTREIDGALWVPLKQIADALTLSIWDHRLGVRLHDKVAGIQSNKGAWRGIYRGASVYAPLPGIFESHGFRVERKCQHGVEFYWVGPGPSG